MKTPITVRVDTALLAEARRCAREENRTLTNFIETVLRQRVSGPSQQPSSLPDRTVKRTKDKLTHAA